jgi:L-seryl-tRNA(Ser) seleniumtransferase
LTTLRMLARPQADVAAQAQRLLPAVRAALKGAADASVIEVKSQIGSGSLPVDLIASHAIAVSVPGKRRNALAGRVAAAFRALPTPVVGRVGDGAFVMDFRCLEHEDEFVEQLKHLDLGDMKA